MAFNRRKLVAVYNSVGCCRISMNIFSRINHCVTLSTLLIPNRADFWTEIFVIATGEGECNGRLLDRGKLGRVVHSGGDHRRRTVGHRPLMGEWRHCRSHDRFGASPVVVEGASAETQTDAGPPSSARSVLIWINLLDRTQARAQWARAMLLRSYLGREAFAQAKSELWEREPWMRKYPELFQR